MSKQDGFVTFIERHVVHAEAALFGQGGARGSGAEDAPRVGRHGHAVLARHGNHRLPVDGERIRHVVGWERERKGMRLESTGVGAGWRGGRDDMQPRTMVAILVFSFAD